MRANHKMQRVFVEADLSEGVAVPCEQRQAHYLVNVLRMATGKEVLVFNGRDGEWRAALDARSKKGVLLRPSEQTRPQPAAPDLLYCFAPLKQGRMDYLVQKAVEMGAGVLQPVMTQHTQGAKPAVGKIRANAIEAAEQCGILSVPNVWEPVQLEDCLERWDAQRRLIFCDEEVSVTNPLPALRAITETRFGLLVGPEGGFSDTERQRLHSLPFVTAIPLGPRILRADTAAVAALALVQATIGDW